MKRREFITLLGGAAAWPLAARAQQGNRVRRIGVLQAGDENDPEEKRRYSAFSQALAGLGWTVGRNLRIDLHWPGGDINRIRALAQELVDLQLDIILANSTPATIALQRETRTIPIVFLGLFDPVASGIVPRLDRPGGNITGFATYEASLTGKHLELSRRSRRGSSGPHSCSIPTWPPYRLIPLPYRLESEKGRQHPAPRGGLARAP
jgi:putative ABC transport system substrate-binding protein